eukprot:gene10289-2435_t
MFALITVIASVLHRWAISIRDFTMPYKDSNFNIIDNNSNSPYCSRRSSLDHEYNDDRPESPSRNSPLKYLFSSPIGLQVDSAARKSFSTAPDVAPALTLANGPDFHMALSDAMAQEESETANEITTIESNLQCSQATELSTMVVMLVTANVGTIFEQSVLEANPEFIALHLQEVGGKNYRVGMQYVKNFVQTLCGHPVICNYYCTSVAILDTDFDSDDFTALGNIYLIRNEVSAALWDFDQKKYCSVSMHQCFESSSKDSLGYFRRHRFPNHFYPQVEWTRKGYCQTRWQLNKHELELVNLHLFHDASNLVSAAEEPSIYAKNRKRAIDFVVASVSEHMNSEGIGFFFGDMNFRLSHSKVLEHFASSSSGKSTKIHGESLQEISLLDADCKNAPLLVVKEKEFLLKSSKTFLVRRGGDFRKFDIEGESPHPTLQELPINFEPSYPYSEDPDIHDEFLTKRCPAWCDRILMTEAAMQLITPVGDNAYDLVGRNVCTGDHKKVHPENEILMWEMITFHVTSLKKLNSINVREKNSENNDNQPHEIISFETLY